MVEYHIHTRLGRIGYGARSGLRVIRYGGGTGGYGGRSAYGGSGRYDCPCAHQPTDARRADARGGRRKSRKLS